MATTFTRKSWITGETITDTKLNNEKGYYLLNDDGNNFEIQVGNLTIDDLTNIIWHYENQYRKFDIWYYEEGKYQSYRDDSIHYYPSTGILTRSISGGGPI